jgi:catechol 2,3-dioxygenase-like lactoylglutathione lyase family enzyme
MDMKLEVVVIPVSDVDRARDFYTSMGWRLDADVVDDDEARLVQLTPPGSACSIQFGTDLTSTAPGSAQSLYLVVSDLEAARTELIGRGVDVGPVFHCVTGFACRFGDQATKGRIAGPAPERATYASFATFADPDGNGWLLQEITSRLPGR